MKKMILVLLLLLAATAVYAQQINLGNFPVGRWLDANYNAVWEFTSSNIRITVDGNVVFDFSQNTVQNFRVSMDGTQPSITFSCPEAGRTYRFTTRLPATGLRMTIDREGLPQYTVDMSRQ